MSRIGPPNTKCQPQDPTTVTRDTASQDPLLVRARVFVGCLKRDTCTTEDVISLFSMYGPLRGVSLFAPQGFAYIQYENPNDAEDAVLNLNKFKFMGSELNVKIADPKRQKVMNQSQGQQQSWTGRMGANQQRQANLGKNQRPKYGNYQQHTASNFFGTNRTVSSFAGKPPPKIGNTSGAPNSKKPRFLNTYQQDEYTQEPYYTQASGYNYEDRSKAGTSYQGYQNPYAEIATTYDTSKNDTVGENATYEEGEYIEEEYGDYLYDENTGIYYDKNGQPVEYAEEGTYPEGACYYDEQTGTYYDENYYPIEYGAEGSEDQNAYYGHFEQSSYSKEYATLPEHPTNIEAKSKPRKAEFVNKKLELKPHKRVQDAQEIEERPIHHEYDIPDMFICGGCHFFTANPQYFIQHRSKPCPIKQVERGEDEPELIQCHMCLEPCRNSWDLVSHLGRKHCLYLYNETHMPNSPPEEK